MRVQLTGIHISRDGKPILRDLNLKTHTNEYVVILGSNGAGKTTTLRAIAGLQPIDVGSIEFDGKCVTTTVPRKRSVSMVFQDDALYPHLKVSELIRQGQASAITAGERAKQFDTIVEQSRLIELLDRYPHQLSGGERRRTAIAHAMARGANVRLLDEPLTSLDPSLRPQLLHDLQNWHETSPGTTIHVTHSAEEAMQIANRIAILSDGRIVQFDKPEAIYRCPAHIDAATSLGSPLINLLRFQADELQDDTCRINLQCATQEQTRTGITNLVMGIRPRDWVVDPVTSRAFSTSQKGLSLRATIHRSWISCHEIHAIARWKKQMIRLVLPDHQSGFIDQQQPPQQGLPILLHALPKHIHLFDTKTGQRVDE